MSDAVSVLNGGSFQGAVTISDAGLRGMITLRGDLSDPVLRQAVSSATGAQMPGQREVHFAGDRGIAWMSPDELLVMVPYEDAESAIREMRNELGDLHAMAANVSDARAVIRIAGTGARDVLAKGAPVDLSSDAFRPGMIRRTRLGQVAAAFWMRDDEVFELVCFRSVGAFVFDWLCVAGAPGSLPDHLR